MVTRYQIEAIEAEEKALRFIVDYIKAKSFPPKLVEIGAGQDPKWSKSKTHMVVQRLASKGYIAAEVGEARSIRVIKSPDELLADLELEKAVLAGVRTEGMA